MGTYGDTSRRATLPTTNSSATQRIGDKPIRTCDRCVAPSVAVVVIGDGPSALSLEFCGHHLATITATLADRGHQVHFHH